MPQKDLLRSGRRGRWFKSSRPDSLNPVVTTCYGGASLCAIMRNRVVCTKMHYFALLLSWSSEFICPIWVGRLADPTTRLGCIVSLD
jgi:hypothetical protein